MESDGEKMKHLWEKKAFDEKNVENNAAAQAMSDGGFWTADAVIIRWYQSLRPESKLAFLTAFIIGLITHMFMFVNKLPNGDDVASMYHNFSMVTSGRWFDKPAMTLSSYYSMPWVTGLVALFFLALSVVLVCRILEIRRAGSVILTAGLMATFPALASYFSYMFYADLYMIAQFMSLLAIWLAKKYSWGCCLGALLLACCLGSYQAYIGIAVVICLLSLLQEILANEKSWPQVFGLGLRYLVTGILGVLAYFLILNWLLDYLQVALVDYQGIDSMGRITMKELGKILPKAYKDFWNYFALGTYFDSPLYIKIIYTCLGVTGLLLVGIALVRRGSYKNKLSLLLLPLFALLPPAYNLVYFMAPKAYLHSLMQPQYALLFVMPLCFYEVAYPISERSALERRDGSKVVSSETNLRESTSNETTSSSSEYTSSLSEPQRLRDRRLASLCSWVLVIGTGLVTYNFFLTTNICYLNLHLKYEITYATQLRILDRIEQHPDYTRETPVLFLGYFPNEAQSLQPYYTRDFTKNMVGVNGNLVHHYHNYKGFYQNYLGVNLTFATDEQAAAVKEKVAQLDMPVWPAAGSVDIVDGIMVVHINKDNQAPIKIW